jgi:hypothetical protein
MGNYSRTRIPGPIGTRIGFNPSQWIEDVYSKPLGRAAFTNIDRLAFRETLKARCNRPSLIDQSVASLCGPASLMYLIASDNPGLYSQYANDLYETGQALLGALRVAPGEDCRSYNPTGKIAAADWVTLASLRDSENAVFDYDDADDAFAGITLPGQLSDWLGAVGYQSVSNETNLYFTKGEGNFREAVSLLNMGYRVCLFIDLNGVDQGIRRGRLRQIFTTANHWVVLKEVSLLTTASVKFTIYTWGHDDHAVPRAGLTMSMEDWLQNYYGYVAGKP